MAGPVPCLGYSSRTEAVVALRGQGLGITEIATKVGITRKQVHALAESARRHRTRGLSDRPRDTTPAASSIYELFPYHQRALVRDHAARRGVTCARLVQILVETVIAEDIVDAVLDDADDLGRWAS